MMLPPRRCLAALLFALALAPRLAAADPVEASDADRATARTLTLEGYDALDHKDYTAAVDRFTRADSLYHVPTVSIGLAQAQVGLGKLVSALAQYSRVLRDGVPPNAPPAFVKAMDDARREIDALTPRIPSVVLVVHGAGSAGVTVDGVEVPAAALGVKRAVDPGDHVVRATAPGFAAVEVKVKLLEGKVETVTLEMKPEQTAPAVTVAPVVTAPPPPVAPPIPPPDESSSQSTIGVVALGVGGVGLLVGAITGGLALGKHSSLIQACPSGHCLPSQKATLQSDVDAYSTLGAISTAGFIAGGVGLGAGAILLLTAPRSRPTRDATVTPVIGLGYVGAQGSF